jgi:hypothetical protein
MYIKKLSQVDKFHSWNRNFIWLAKYNKKNLVVKMCNLKVLHILIYHYVIKLLFLLIIKFSIEIYFQVIRCCQITIIITMD